MNRKELLRGVAIVGLALSGCSPSAELAGSTLKQIEAHSVEVTTNNDSFDALQTLLEIDNRCHVQKQGVPPSERWSLENLSQVGNRIRFITKTEEENCVDKFR